MKFIVSLLIVSTLMSCSKYYEKKEKEKERISKENILGVHISNLSEDTLKNIRMYMDEGYLTDTSDILTNENKIPDIIPNSVYFFEFDCRNKIKNYEQGFCLKYTIDNYEKAIYTLGVENYKVKAKTLDINIQNYESQNAFWIYWKY